MKRFFKQTFAILLLGLTVAATAQQITWWAPNWEQARAEELVQRFEAENPDIDINLEITTGEGLQNRILVALRSGTTPDLIDVANGWNIPFATTGELMPLAECVANGEIDLDDFNDASLGTANFNDQLYGLPYRIEAHALIYNKGLYRQAGLDPEDPPETWTELIEYSQALSELSNNGQPVYGFGIAGGGEVSNTLFRSLPFIWMNGGSILSEDYTEAILDEPAAVEAVEFYTDFYTELGVAPPSTLENDGVALRRLFIAGTVAQYQSGQFDIPAIQQENPDLDIGTAMIPHPEGADTAAILGGWNWVIPRAAGNPEAACTFLTFLAQTENMGFYTDTFPARESAMDLPRFQEPLLQAFQDMLPYARPQPPVESWIQITQTYFDSVQRILLEQATPQEVMENAAQQIDRLLNR